jgi:hypothetical protein
MLKRQEFPWFTPSAADPCFCCSGQSFGECCGSRSADRMPPAGVHLFPGFLDPATCNKWVKRLETRPLKRSTVEKIQRNSLSTEDNPARVCRDVNPGVLRKMISDCVIDAFRLVTTKTGDIVAWYEAPSILRYQSGGYFLAHADNCLLDPASNTWFKVIDRDLSLLLYLNEDFTGGGLSFVNFNFHVRPRTGDLLVFPSDNRYAHQAEVVESGFRYVVVSWAALSGSQRVCDNPPQGAIYLK